MTSPPSAPSRRRRRIVVTTIAVLAVGLGWWFWPSADSRFVGNWEWIDVAKGKPVQYCNLRTNGTGRYVDVNGRWTIEFCWSVRGSELLIGKQCQGFVKLVYKYVSGCLGTWLHVQSERYTINFIGPDAAQLHFVEVNGFPQNALYDLRRISQ
jgi:hypothetical protein